MSNLPADSAKKFKDIPLFPLGQMVMTRGAIAVLQESNELVTKFLWKHQTGDWGEVCEDDKKQNDEDLKNGNRLLSSYKTQTQKVIWVITEWDRSVTTVLLPSEY
jgi:hypothetical protein